MGSGKTTVGAALAARLNRPFIDLDLVIIEKAGIPIHQIISEKGESEFRRLESEALAEAAGSTAVIATGGGIITRDDNRRLMNEKGLTIWLDAPFEICWQRILTDGVIRPLAPDHETALERFKDRRPLYEAAGLRIAIDDENADRAAELIACKL